MTSSINIEFIPTYFVNLSGLVKGNWRIKKGDKKKGKRKGAEECETSPVKSPPNQTTMHQPNTQASPLKTTPEKSVARSAH